MYYYGQYLDLHRYGYLSRTETGACLLGEENTIPMNYNSVEVNKYFFFIWSSDNLKLF